MIARVVSLFMAMGVATASHAAPSAESRTAPLPEVMLVATYHLANNNRDIINLPIEDILSPHRQREIEQLVDDLAQWQPARVAVEWDRSDQAGLDRRFADYLAGNLDLSANERDQIAFRLAKKLGLSKVYAIDWNEQGPGGPSDYDFIEWARRNGQGSRFDTFVREGQAEADQTASNMRDQTVSQWYYALNSPDMWLNMHQQYFTLASFGSNDLNPGAAWVGAWYARNLRIFNNIREIIRPEERVLVLYGVGHAYLLDRFLRESEAATPIDPRRYIARQWPLARNRSALSDGSRS